MVSAYDLGVRAAQAHLGLAKVAEINSKMLTPALIELVEQAIYHQKRKNQFQSSTRKRV